MAAKELPKEFTTKVLAVAPTLGQELLDVSEQLHEPISISKSTPRNLDGPTI